MPDDDKLSMVMSDSSPIPTIDRTMEMNGEIWMTTNDHSMIGSRVPFTKREKELLCTLIQKHVYSKITGPNGNPSVLPFAHGSSTTFCRVPNAAWKAIAEEYNAKENVRKRSIKQLRKCWENLKHRGKINPKALFSGKRLLGRTSLSGAFTLTTEEDETDLNVKLSPPRSLEDFENEASVAEEGQVRITDSVAAAHGRNIFSSVGTSGTAESSFAKYDDDEEISQNIGKYDMHKDNSREEIVPSSTFAAATPHLIVTAPQLISSSSRPTMVSPRITNVRTVRSLKPVSEQYNRRFPVGGSFSRVNGSRSFSNYPMLAKTHTQRMQEMKVKLMAARIKEHEANVEKINLQMRQAQAHHDVTMRLLRTKASWYDAHLRQLEKQLQNGDLSLVGEEDDDYRGDAFGEEDNVQYEDSYN